MKTSRYRDCCFIWFRPFSKIKLKRIIVLMKRIRNGLRKNAKIMRDHSQSGILSWMRGMTINVWIIDHNYFHKLADAFLTDISCVWVAIGTNSQYLSPKFPRLPRIVSAEFQRKVRNVAKYTCRVRSGGHATHVFSMLSYFLPK